MSNCKKECQCKIVYGCVCGQKIPEKVIKLIEAFGGIENIKGFNCSVSELRYDLKNSDLIDEKLFLKLGAINVSIFSEINHVRVELKENAENVNTEIKKFAHLITKDSSEINKEDFKQTNATECHASKTSKQVVLSPTSGKIVSLKELNDGIFSNNMVGEGVAILLEKDNKIVAPFDGKITLLTANKNQLIFSSKEHIEVVMVLGLNSYKLDGIGIEAKVKANQEVKAGEVLFELDLAKFENENIDKHIIICATESSLLNKIKNLSVDAKRGVELFELE
ncbi:PTS glucose transporter subunit IIA [Mycoplasmopsis cynos]|uniref:PTS glucose transporter subunit IIA n=1 Tax=Mycoplasmopsis cynos TaxID=171284 RepID=UPI002AFF75BD|nr:PTS glucose transporter subunit IIA [Mycoplasmopsis cynos]WQQ15066.1 PTS glucose transporter subunit IIA [Mycoplasmopsis cynos]